MNETIISRHVHNSIMRVTGILDISEAVMNGEVEYQKGNIDQVSLSI